MAQVNRIRIFFQDSMYIGEATSSVEAEQMCRSYICSMPHGEAAKCTKRYFTYVLIDQGNSRFMGFSF